MTEVAARKRELILAAELHRQTIVEESAKIGAQAQAAREVVSRNRWLIGGVAAAAGVVIARRPKALLNIVPTLVAAWRSFRARRGGAEGETPEPTP